MLGEVSRMNPISEYIDRPLRLVKKSFFSLEYVLFAGEELLGTFKIRLFKKGGFVSGLGKKDVQFYKDNFFSREILIREDGKELPFANYKKELTSRSGVVDLSSGNKLLIKFNFFDVITEIQDDKGKTLVTLKRTSLISRSINVTIKEKSQLVDDNPWILFLALYQIIKRRSRRR